MGAGGGHAEPAWQKETLCKEKSGEGSSSKPSQQEKEHFLPIISGWLGGCLPWDSPGPSPQGPPHPRTHVLPASVSLATPFRITGPPPLCSGCRGHPHRSAKRLLGPGLTGNHVGLRAAWTPVLGALVLEPVHLGRRRRRPHFQVSPQALPHTAAFRP